MNKYELPAVIAFVKSKVGNNNFTPYELSRIIEYWFSTGDNKKFSKKKFTNPRMLGLENNRVNSAFFYLINLKKDESSKCESITSVDKKGSKNDHDFSPFNLDIDSLNLLNEDYEKLDEILKNIELSYIGNLDDLIKFHTKKDGEKHNKGKLINIFALSLSIDPNFKAMYDLGVLYERNNKIKASISCYECLGSFSTKTIEDEKIQIKPWRQRIKHYKYWLKTDKVNEKDKKRYLNKAIKLCERVSKSKAVSESERENAIKKLQRLNEKRVASMLVQSITDAVSS